MTDITLHRETDETIQFSYFETDGTTSRVLTGATVYFTVKVVKYSTVADDTDALIKTDVTPTDPANGKTDINLSHLDTAIAPLVYFYDIKVKEQDGKIYLAQQGRCTVTTSPTNRT